MVKLLETGAECEDGEQNALSKRLEKIQFKTLKPLLWKSLTQESFMTALSEMGLSSFFNFKFMPGDERLCREFLCSYRKHGAGMVKQQIIQTDPKVVQAALNLPHTGKLVKEVPKLSSSELYGLYNGPTVKVKHNGFSVKALCDPYFKEFVSFLVDRMSCKVNCTYVSAEILYAAKYVWDTRSVLDWASYMSHRIQAQCDKVRATSQSAYEYTQYLTQIIHHQLGVPPPENGAHVTEVSTSSQHVRDLGEQLGENSKRPSCELVEDRLLNGHAGKRHKKQVDSKASKRQRTAGDGAEQAVSLLDKVSSWIQGQAAEKNERLDLVERRVVELESELGEMRRRLEGEQQRRFQSEAELNLVREEKSVLKDQVQRLLGQQQAMREQCEREKAQMSAYFARALKEKVVQVGET